MKNEQSRNLQPAIWISWEHHRRSREMSACLHADQFVATPQEMGLIRRLSFTFKTIRQHQPEVLFVQNPSRILAAWATLLKPLFRYKLIVDRHTNFRIGKPLPLNPREVFVILCSEFSLRFADLTIVTNPYLQRVVERKGGSGFVLPDKIPDLDKRILPRSKEPFSSKYNVLFICTFADDEPFREVMEAAAMLHHDIGIYVTGKYENALSQFDINSLSPNVTLLGFVPDAEYDRLLWEADLVLDFTSLEWCLVCGGYEALAAARPLVTSDTQALREYFSGAAVHTTHSARAIAEGIHEAIDNLDSYAERMKTLKERRSMEWKESFKSLKERIESL